jgi:hypothetical protein
VKVRAGGFRELHKWPDGADLLVLRADQKIPLVIVRLPLAIEIARTAEQNNQK